jgi:hypothetical protein
MENHPWENDPHPHIGMGEDDFEQDLFEIDNNNNNSKGNNNLGGTGIITSPGFCEDGGGGSLQEGGSLGEQDNSYYHEQLRRQVENSPLSTSYFIGRGKTTSAKGGGGGGGGAGGGSLTGSRTGSRGSSRGRSLSRSQSPSRPPGRSASNSPTRMFGAAGGEFFPATATGALPGMGMTRLNSAEMGFTVEGDRGEELSPNKNINSNSNNNSNNKAVFNELGYSNEQVLLAPGQDGVAANTQSKSSGKRKSPGKHRDLYGTEFEQQQHSPDRVIFPVTSTSTSAQEVQYLNTAQQQQQHLQQPSTSATTTAVALKARERKARQQQHEQRNIDALKDFLLHKYEF